MLKLYRWLCYLGFAMGAALFWALFFFGLLGVVPFAEPLCALEPAGCPPPSALQHLLTAIFLLSILPMTTLLFVFFRRRMRKRMGMEDDL
jgi:dolichyl-phosphate-mannose--protein O-mannosyl transferase